MTKPRVEVKEELQERLEVLELARTTREEKLAKESAMLGGAHEVRFEERAFRPGKEISIEEIRYKVDAISVARRDVALPEPAPLPPPPAPIVVPKPVSDEHRAALSGVVKGKLLAVETIYRTEAGEIVEARFAAKEGEVSQSFILRDGKARALDEVDRRVDELPAPRALPSAPEPVAPSATKIEEPKAKAKLSLPFGKKKGAESAPPAQDAKPEKKRFGFGGKR